MFKILSAPLISAQKFSCHVKEAPSNLKLITQIKTASTLAHLKPSTFHPMREGTSFNSKDNGIKLDVTKAPILWVPNVDATSNRSNWNASYHDFQTGSLQREMVYEPYLNSIKNINNACSADPALAATILDASNGRGPPLFITNRETYWRPLRVKFSRDTSCILPLFDDKFKPMSTKLPQDIDRKKLEHLQGNQFVYVEDDQGYWKNHVLMYAETDEVTPELMVELEQITWDIPDAGRFSVDFNTFMAKAANHGIQLAPLDYVFGKPFSKEPNIGKPLEWGKLLMAKGATGNY